IPDKDEEPVAWTNRSSGGGRVFYTSLGHIDDFQSAAFRKLLTNGIQWTLRSDKDSAKKAE
ncbi:MAG: ThuA domain-containing protein, partial [Planctomycetaceae bacterium]